MVVADTPEEALDKIHNGDFERYRVINHDFARTQQIGGITLDEID